MLLRIPAARMRPSMICSAVNTRRGDMSSASVAATIWFACASTRSSWRWLRVRPANGLDGGHRPPEFRRLSSFVDRTGLTKLTSGSIGRQWSATEKRRCLRSRRHPGGPKRRSRSAGSSMNAHPWSMMTVEVVKTAKHDIRFDVPMYTVAEAARALDVPPTTLSTWAFGYVRRPSGRREHRGDAILTGINAAKGQILIQEPSPASRIFGAFQPFGAGKGAGGGLPWTGRFCWIPWKNTSTRGVSMSAVSVPWPW